MREDLHAIVRRELKKHPAHLYCVGHSLGGALATLAALDCSIHTVPRVNAYLARVRYDSIPIYHGPVVCHEVADLRIESSPPLKGREHQKESSLSIRGRGAGRQYQFAT